MPLSHPGGSGIVRLLRRIVAVMDDLDAELRLIEAEEQRQDEAQRRWRKVIDEEPVASIYAGSWFSSEDAGSYTVAVTERAEAVAELLRAAAPDVSIRVVTYQHSHRALEALAESVLSAADRVGAPLAHIGVDHQMNLVEAAFEDLAHPAVRSLHTQFSQEPIRWTQDKVVLAS